MKHIAVFALAALLLTPAQASKGFFRKKKKEKTEKVSAPKKSGYEKLLTGAESAKGSFLSFYKVKNKLYVDMPVKYLGRDILIASTTAESSNPKFAMVGYKPQDPMHVQFERIDSFIVMRSVNSTMECDEQLNSAITRSYNNPILRKMKLEAWNADSTSVVFDLTDLFLGDVDELKPIAERYSILKITSKIKKDLNFIGKCKAFDDNASVESYMTYDCGIAYGSIGVGTSVNVTTRVIRTLLLLPEVPMQARLNDSRVGVFITQKQRITMKEDGLSKYTVANKWRLEPKDTAAYLRGELVEPVKPIVWYIDDTFPQEWKEPLKQSVTQWNKAFERIGFKNAMQAYDFPKDDPEFDPDNLKYSCIRYVPVNIENAMGPSWVDPRSGEIINASVMVYNDVIKLINEWRFVQTAQIDPRVRNKKMPKDIVDESMTYVFAHEIGHTLGLMHNMSASSSFVVDSLRSASFTQQYGTTPSIMDYARFNYVAQPNDKNVRLMPPDIGVYDYYAIDWLYRPYPNMTPEQVAQEKEKLVDSHAGDPLYRYGRQQVSSRYDPTALEEDLGDDALRAGDYGIKNLKYILNNLSTWITDDPTYRHRENLYDGIISQFNRYLNNAATIIGGIKLTSVKEGTKGNKYEPIARTRQQQALKWLVKQMRESEWTNNPITKNFPLQLNRSMSVYYSVTKALLKRDNSILLCSHISNDPYTQAEYYNDLYNLLFEPTIKGKSLSENDKLLERTVVQTLKSNVGKFANSSASKSLVDEAVREFENGDRNYCDVDDFGLQDEVSTSFIDESAALQLEMFKKLRTLFRSRLSGKDKTHYQSLLIQVENCLGKK